MEVFFWRIFWEDFFGRIFLGGFIWEEFFERIVFFCQDFGVILSKWKEEGRKEDFRSLQQKLIALKKILKNYETFFNNKGQ